MADFVAEIRPRKCPSRHHPAACQLDDDDLMTQIKSKSHDQTDLKLFSNHSYTEDTSDQYLQKRLADLHFSRDKLVSLLENSILTLIEKLLTGQSIFKIEGTLHIILCNSESPVIVDLHKYFSGHQGKCLADRSLDTCLKVKIKDRDSTEVCPPCDKSIGGCSPSFAFDRDACHSPPDALKSSNVSSEYHTYHFPPTPQQDTAFLSPPHSNFSVSPTPESHLSSPTAEHHLSSPTHETILSSPSPCIHSHGLNPEVEGTKQMHMSVPDNECDKQMTSETGGDCASVLSDQEETDLIMGRSKIANTKSLSLFTDYFCRGFDGDSSAYLPVVSPDSGVSVSLDSCGSSEEGSDDMEDEEDDVDCEHRLVIDENPVRDSTTTMTTQMCSSLADDNTSNNTDDHHGQSKLSLKHGHKDEADEVADVDSTVGSDVTGSDVTDSEIHMELPGNGESSLDPESVVPHPQSIMSMSLGGFQCRQCSETLQDKSAVAVHVESKHHLYCCTFCCRTFTAKNNLKRHVRRHTGQKPYKCTHCPKTFFRRDDMKGHMIRHDYMKPFRCGLCQKGYTDRSCVKNHMAKEHGSQQIHICPQCGQSFDSDDSFTTHKMSHPELLQFSCKICAFIGTNSLMTLKHSLLHSHKLFSCKPCNAYFADPFQYTSHLRKHKKSGSFSRYVCCFCNMVLATYDQFVRHEYVHAQTKTHPCSICNKQFRSKYFLREHSITHQQVDEADVKCQENVETDRLLSRLLKPRTFQPNTIKDQSIMSKTDSAGGALRMTCKSGTETPEQTKDTDDYEFCGQLLDLSMKKSPSLSLNKDATVGHRTVGGGLASLRTAGLHGVHFPRNGEVSSEPVNLSKKREVTRQSSPTRQAMERQGSPTRQALERQGSPTRQVLERQGSPTRQALERQNENIYLSVLQMIDNKLTQDQGTRLERAGRCESDIALQPRSFCQNSLRSPYRPPSLRFSPYSREKMADLALKYVAARGVTETGHAGKLKAIISVGEDRNALLITEQNVQRKHPSFVVSPLKKDRPVLKDDGRRNVGQALDDNDEAVSEYSNPEMAVRCHIPSFIKCEPESGREENLESPADCHFQTSETELKTAKSRATRGEGGGNHGCDLCAEKFASFSDLENHSVEIHKRYLCQHCRKSFTARPNRDRHVRYHTGERPYRCDLCDLAFFRGDDLKYHRTTRHPSAQPYVCTHCSASFTWGRDLERHIRHSKCKV